VARPTRSTSRESEAPVGDSPIAEWLSEICAAFAAEGALRRFERNAIIFLQGEPSTAAYAVKSGRVELLSIRESGREVGHSIRNSGEVFGVAELVLRRPRARTTRAMEATELWTVSAERFWALLERRPEITLALLGSSLHRGIQGAEMRMYLTGTSARQRVASALSYLAGRSGSPPACSSTTTVRITHEQLARLCGLTRQTVTSELDRLGAQGLLVLGSRSIELADPDRLRQVLEAGA
jgi:CRP-like cAMP-binding protein